MHVHIYFPLGMATNIRIFESRIEYSNFCLIFESFMGNFINCVDYNKIVQNIVAVFLLFILHTPKTAAVNHQFHTLC